MKSIIYGMAMMAGIMLGSSGIAQAAIMSGRVLRSDESGQGVANVTVEAISYKPAYESYSTTTDAGGYYSMINAWPDGLSFCSVKLKEENGATFSPPNISVTGGQDYQGLDFTMEPPDNSTRGLRICTLTVHIGNPELADGYFWRVWYNGGVPLTLPQTSLLQSPWTDRASGDSHEWMPYDSWYVIEFKDIGGYRKPENMVVYTDGSGWGDIKQLTNNFQVTGTYESLPVILDSSPEETESGLFYVKGFDSSGVVGSGPYMYKSYFTVFAGAAVHAGAVDLDEWGVVQITNRGNQCSFAGSTANGITSTSEVLCTEYAPAKPGYTFEESERLTVTLEGKGGVDVPSSTHWYLLCDEWKIGGFTNGQTIAVPASLSYEIEFGRAQNTPGSDVDDWISPVSVNGAGGGEYTGEYVRPGDYSTSTPVLPTSAVALGEGEAGNAEVVQDDSENPLDTGEESCASGQRGDPVLLWSGKFYLNLNDEMILGKMPILWNRIYSTTFTYDGPLGYGWTHSYNQRLYMREGSDIVLRNGDWTRTVFTNRGDDVYTAPGGVSLVPQGDNWVLSETAALDKVFDSLGRLILISDSDSNQLMFSYVQETRQPVLGLPDYSLSTGQVMVAEMYRLDQIVQAHDGVTNGCGVFMEYDGGGRLVQVILSYGGAKAEQQLNYRYDENGSGNLVEYIDADGVVYPYTYDDSHRMLTFYEGCVCNVRSNRYDEAGRVCEQTMAGTRVLFDYLVEKQVTRTTTIVASGKTGLPVREEVEYFYFLDSGKTWKHVVQMGEQLDPEGGESDDLVTEYHYDELAGIETGVTYPGGMGKEITFDEAGYVTSMIWTGEDGSEIMRCFEYGPHGVTNQYDIYAGPPESRVMSVATTYDEIGRIVSVVQQGGEGQEMSVGMSYQTNEIDGTRVTVSNGAGRAIQCDLNGEGQLAGIVDPTSQSNIVSYGHNVLGYRTNKIDALGRETVYKYNEQGEIVRIEYPCGMETLCEYSQGNLVRREDGRTSSRAGLVSLFEYDDDGRLRAEYGVGNGTTTLVKRIWYDSDGRLEEIETRAGIASARTYDSAGRIIGAQVWGVGQSNRFDQASRLIENIGPDGARTLYEYDGLGQITEVVEAAGTPFERTTSYEYNDAGQIVAVEGEDGLLQKFEYDEFGQLIAREGTGILPQTFEYDAGGKLTGVGYADGSVFTYVYDERGRRVRTVYPDETEESYEHDAVGNLTRFEDRLGSSIYYVYDAADRLVSISARNQPDVAIEFFEYDSLGGVQVYSNAAGVVRRIDIDDFGLVTNIVRASGVKQSFVYDEIQRPVSIMWSDGTMVSNEYDGPFLVRTSQRDGSEHRMQYDEAGRLSIHIPPSGLTNAYSHDVFGRLATFSNDIRGAVSYHYDSLNRLTCMELPAARIVNLEYDEYGRLTNRWGWGHHPVRMEYDWASNMTNLIDAAGRHHVRAYTLMGKVHRREYPDGSYLAFWYDADGKTVSNRTASGRITRYEYNAQRYLSMVAFGPEEAIHYEYDILGHLQSISTGGFTNEYEHDGMGRIIRERQGSGEMDIQYEYDGERIDRMRYGDWVIDYGCDAAGRLIQLDTPLGRFEYLRRESDGGLESVVYPCGMMTSNRLDCGGQLMERILVDVDMDVFSDVTIFRDRMGLVTNLVYDDGLHDHLAYDGTGQLSQVRRLLSDNSEDDTYQYLYGYDGVGNWTQRVANGSSVSIVNNNLDQISEVTFEGGGRLQPIYDADGQLVYDGVDYYRWSNSARLIGLSNATRTLSFEYDAIGRMVRRTRSEAGQWRFTVEYTYDDWMPIHAVQNEPGATSVVRYAWGCDRSGRMERTGNNGSLLAAELSASANTSVCYYVHDYRGNVSGIADDAGRIIETFQYSPFGRILSGSAPNGIRDCWGFSGKLHIEGGDLVYYGMRFYHAGLGRWISRDPLGSQRGFSAYGMVENDPVNRLDSLGLSSELAKFGQNAFWGFANLPGTLISHLTPLGDSYSKALSMRRVIGEPVHGNSDACIVAVNGLNNTWKEYESDLWSMYYGKDLATTKTVSPDIKQTAIETGDYAPIISFNLKQAMAEPDQPKIPVYAVYNNSNINWTDPDNTGENTAQRMIGMFMDGFSAFLGKLGVDATGSAISTTIHDLLCSKKCRRIVLA
ncbi:MAG: DUF6531 domain-containing protein [Kiritimatiellae bacterium]|nr:DUF6531 domain-containing protein [Kiritimatiellia bacterium]